MWWICDGLPRRRAMKRGLYLAPFDELADPRVLAELARLLSPEVGTACSCGIGSRIRPRTAPWVALSDIAFKTDSLRIGPMITPLSRRRVQKVARETVTLDYLMTFAEYGDGWS
jgi:alkanesulfonate monooxygenase SsuD/methylene tetrahydromethanopterin reductase-like flavin-dependent oxidoreductase (luciferase family)